MRGPFSLGPKFLDVSLRKPLLDHDFLLLCAARCSHATVLHKFLSSMELRDTPCTQKTVGGSGCVVDLSYCLAITCNQHPPSSQGA